MAVAQWVGYVCAGPVQGQLLQQAQAVMQSRLDLAKHLTGSFLLTLPRQALSGLCHLLQQKSMSNSSMHCLSPPHLLVIVHLCM